MNSTERTSAQSKLNAPSKFQTVRKQDDAGVGGNQGQEVLSQPGTSDTKKRDSIGDFHSSAFSQDEQTEKKLKDQQNAGKMLNSDGFEVGEMEADDFETLTLQQKILCGYYTAKPYNKGAYPLD